MTGAGVGLGVTGAGVGLGVGAGVGLGVGHADDAAAGVAVPLDCFWNLLESVPSETKKYAPVG